MLTVAANSLNGFNVVVTGKTLNASRSDVTAAIIRAGGNPQHSVDRSTDFLVASNPARQTTKQQTAIKLNVPILSDVTFRDVIEGRVDAAQAIRTARAGLGMPAAPQKHQAQAQSSEPAMKIDFTNAFGARADADPFGITF